jgi:cell division protein FtsI (penicillin-binding protein 3)
MFRNQPVKPIDWVSVRVALVALLFAVGAVMLIARAYKLQISEADALRKDAEKRRTRVIHLEARRGAIFDRSGDQIAVSLEVNSVYAKPKQVVNITETAQALAGILGVDSAEISKKLGENKPFVWIQRRVLPLHADKVRKAGFPGIMIGTEYQRFYPLKSFAANVIGFAGLDSTGLEGLELFYDQDLKVEPIPVTAQVDALGRPVILTAMGQDPKRRDLHVTLDRNIQYIAERELDEAVQHYEAKSGVAVVMDADSGEILALAVNPSYNINVFQKVSPDVKRNRAVTDPFEPGSTFKVFLAAAALELERVSPGEMFDCNNGKLKYYDWDIHDVVPHKTLSFEDVIIHSSNIGAIKISEKLKKTEFYRILNNFGFGSNTGVDLPGERPGVLALPGKWSAVSKGTIAFGQGITVNALQLSAAFAAAINGGNLYRPHLIKSMTNALGETISENPEVGPRKIIKESTSEKIVEILRDVVLRGTGKAAAIPGADVIGKTGTAQKVDSSGAHSGEKNGGSSVEPPKRRGYSQDKYVASFIGAIMASKPRLVIFVMLDEPAGKIRQGGKAAAPVFKKIGEAVLAACGRKPTDLENILASGTCPVKKSPAPQIKSVPLRKGPHPGEWITPDLKGLGTKQVTEICGKMKCDLSLQGVGFVADQTPKPGQVFKEGAPFSVTFD